MEGPKQSSGHLPHIAFPNGFATGELWAAAHRMAVSSGTGSPSPGKCQWNQIKNIDTCSRVTFGARTGVMSLWTQVRGARTGCYFNILEIHKHMHTYLYISNILYFYNLFPSPKQYIVSTLAFLQQYFSCLHGIPLYGYISIFDNFNISSLELFLNAVRNRKCENIFVHIANDSLDKVCRSVISSEKVISMFKELSTYRHDTI